MAAPTKAHDIKKTLANGEPSTHGAMRKRLSEPPTSAFQNEPDIVQIEPIPHALARSKRALAPEVGSVSPQLDGTMKYLKCLLVLNDDLSRVWLRFAPSYIPYFLDNSGNFLKYNRILALVYWSTIIRQAIRPPRGRISR